MRLVGDDQIEEPNIEGLVDLSSVSAYGTKLAI
jgi:hypothetical protein